MTIAQKQINHSLGDASQQILHNTVSPEVLESIPAALLKDNVAKLVAMHFEIARNNTAIKKKGRKQKRKKQNTAERTPVIPGNKDKNLLRK